MYTPTLLLSLLLTTTLSASPTPQSTSTSTTPTPHTIGLTIQTSPSNGGSDPKTTQSATITLNNLTSLSGISASTITFDGTASNIDIELVQCHVYQDADGVVPGSAQFNVSSPALLSTNLVELGTVLCYVG